MNNKDNAKGNAKSGARDASKNDSNTTSSPTSMTHDEQTGHDELSRKAHVSGKETVGETTEEIMKRKGVEEKKHVDMPSAQTVPAEATPGVKVTH